MASSDTNLPTVPTPIPFLDNSKSGRISDPWDRWFQQLKDKVNKNNVLTIKSDTLKIKPVRDVVMHTNQVSKDVAIWNDINELIERIYKLDSAL